MLSKAAYVKAHIQALAMDMNDGESFHIPVLSKVMTTTPPDAPYPDLAMPQHETIILGVPYDEYVGKPTKNAKYEPFPGKHGNTIVYVPDEKGVNHTDIAVAQKASVFEDVGIHAIPISYAKYKASLIPTTWIPMDTITTTKSTTDLPIIHLEAPSITWTYANENVPKCPECDETRDDCTCEHDEPEECEHCGSTWCSDSECLHCDDCGELEDDCGCGESENEWDVIHDIWNLPTTLDLRPIAADYYLLYDLRLDDADEGRYEAWMDANLATFVSYTDMVVGGELRHAREMAQQVLRDGSSPLHELILETGLPHDRGAAWHAWYDFRQTHGTDALRWATEIYAEWGSNGENGYGGAQWASISDTLLMYEEGLLTPTAFVDVCWGLEHNNGCYFSKAPWTSDVKELLGHARHGNYGSLLPHATDEVRELYTRVRGG